jgi:ABC-type multidrug transport system permease subunit
MLQRVSAVVRRDFLATASYRLAFVLDIGYGVLDLLVYFFISETFEGLSSEDLSGAPSYFAFAAVGIVLGTVLDSTSSGVGYRTREEQLTGTLENLAAQPVSSVEICLGSIGFPFVFAVFRATLYLAIAAAAMDLDVGQTDWFGLGCVLVASGVAMAPIGVIAGAAVLVFKRGHVVAGTLVYLLTILGGMVFPVSVLPDWLEPLAALVPITYAFDGARDALFTGSGWSEDVAVLVAWSAVLWPVSLLLYDRGLVMAKRAGSLAQY